MNKITGYAMTAVLSVTLLTPITVYAEGATSSKLELYKTSVTFDKKHSYDTASIFPKDSSEKITKAVSSNKAVAKVATKSGYVEIKPGTKSGTAAVKVTSTSGKTGTVKVKVSSSWKKANFEFHSYAYSAYADRTVTIGSKPGARVKLKIGKHSYKSRKIGKKGMTVIKLKKNYRVGTKYTVTYSYKGMKLNYTKKIYSNTYASYDTLWSCKNYIPVNLYHITAGDTVYLKAGGKTYKRKMYGLITQ